MSVDVTFIGFGEAGRAFAAPGARAFDVKTSDTVQRAEMLAAFASHGVDGAEDAGTALAGTAAVLVLVNADQALAAARACAPHLAAGVFWFDMNSVAPATKRNAARVIEAAGGCYVDVAVMAPVLPAKKDVPLLVSGPDADDAAALLDSLGFGDVAIIGQRVGDASAIKMIRSVMVKGLEALSAECALAAHVAGVSDEVMNSLDASWREQGWRERIDYNLERMLVHGLRRAEEMEEAARMLEDLGIDPLMTRGTIARERAAGSIGRAAPAELAAKLEALCEAGIGKPRRAA